MRKTLNNQACRVLVLMLVVLFAVPCLACDDALGGCRDHESHGSVQTFHSGTSDCDCDIHGTEHDDAPPCGCLSDSNKVRNDRPVDPVILPVTVLPPVLAALPPPVSCIIGCAEPTIPPRPHLSCAAVADRAPPSV